MDSEHGADAQPAADKRYEYIAFISYKHEDMRWAKWLQNRLETYRLPASSEKKPRTCQSTFARSFATRPTLAPARSWTTSAGNWTTLASLSSSVRRRRRNRNGSTRKCRTSCRWAGATGSFR